MVDTKHIVRALYICFKQRVKGKCIYYQRYTELFDIAFDFRILKFSDSEINNPIPINAIIFAS